MKRPSLYWAGLLAAAAMLLLSGIQIDSAQDAQQQARQAIAAARHSLFLAEHRQREIERLQRNCRELQQALDAAFGERNQ